MECVVSNRYYESDILELKNDILSGKFQMEFIKDGNKSNFIGKENNILNCKVTFEEPK